MKKWQIQKKQLIHGAIMLSLAVPLLLFALSIDSKTPTLAFEGVKMEMREDGDVQMLVEVSIKNIGTSKALPVGARFELNYNTEYLTPSRQDSNAPLKNGEEAFLAFQFDPNLYIETENGVPVSKDPFEKSDGKWNLNTVVGTTGKLGLSLVADRNIVPSAGSGLTEVRSGQTSLNVFNTEDKIVLGTLSFRVEKENLDKLPEIKENFDYIEALEDPKGKNGKYLINNVDLKVPTWQSGSWSIVAAYEVKAGEANYTQGYLDNSDMAKNITNMGSSAFTYKPYAESRFTFDFPKIIIGVEAAEAELTIDAYQAYTDGVVSDLDIALQKYSPAVLVKYSDGSQENVIFPWGRFTAPWATSEVTDWNTTAAVTDDNYDPTHGDYKIQKHYVYKDEGTGVEKVFPLPVSVHLRVTPITLLKVAADDLYRVYQLNNALVNSITGVQSRGDLDLPEEAHLITDLPAGGATLTMQIPGWSHINEPGDETVAPEVAPVYWPSSASGTEIKNLWKDGAASGEYLHWPTSDDQDMWTATEGNGSLLGNNRAGLYTFKMAKAYGDIPVAGFAKADIQKKYPWLTVPQEVYPLDDAQRRIVWNHEDSEDDKKLEDKDLYEVTYVSTETNFTTNPELLLPDLTLRVRKHSEGGGAGSLPETSVFRIKMPDGTEIGIGQAGDVDTGNWFDPTNGDSGNYTKTRTNVASPGNPESAIFDLLFNPGRTDAGGNASQRERLLRYINLGGWFSVSINEDPASYYWSDFIPVYVPPRANIHLEDKIYNFIGVNADLYRFVREGAGIPTTVTLPAGSYETVDAVGTPQYDDVLDESGQVIGKVPHEERYGLKTLYSGINGSQFGELNTFTITPSWSVTGEANGITRYGPNDFLDNARYGAYGRVRNPGIDVDTHAPRTYQATIRTEKEPEDPQQLKEKIKLIYTGEPGGVTPYDPNPDLTQRQNVELVTFDTRVEGYTVRQEYTLTILNVGDVDINGLAIDLETDLPNVGNYGSEGGHFTLLKPPASFLPAGEMTTFTLSYVYDLRAQGNGGELEYLDKLFITSDRRHTVGVGAKPEEDYLLDFDARFTVTGNKIHRVWVEYNPSDGYMGTAQVIVGEVPTGSGNMNINAGSNAASMNTVVYVMATPTDEYEVRQYSAVDSSGAPVTLWPYTGPITLSDGTTINIDDKSQIRIWSLIMPDYDVTVTIDFYEPISSKLRLSNLKAYASHNQEDLYKDGAPTPIESRKPFEYAVWQKSFTAQEYQDAENCRPDPSDPAHIPTEEEKGLYLMRGGTAVKKGYSDDVDQYLVVIPFEADYSQIEATLRQVLYPTDGSGNLPQGDGRIEVEMTLFPEDHQDPFTGPNAQIYRDDNGNTATPTVHTSRAFDSPKPGESNYVRVRISYTSAAESESRFYFVEIHRVPQHPVAELNYGNSPYGMIMNAENITDKAAAKKAFVANRYSFNGLTEDLVPAKAKENALNYDLTSLHYWTEAWVAPDAAYEPESHMGFLYYYNNTTGVGTWYPDPNIYKEEDNLDLNNYAFFAILGEDFLDPGLRTVLDSSGRPADISRAIISLDAYTLDQDGATQLERFSLPVDPDDPNLSEEQQAALAARKIHLSRENTAGILITEWSDLKNTDGEYLRPGRYELTYTIPDFDYDEYYNSDPADRDPDRDPTLKVTRDFVILAPVGDVNSNMPAGDADAWQHVSDHVDEQLVKDRVTAPLGYMADYYPDGAIFKLRTCDVNNDRNINNIDANTIRVRKVIERFYLPVDYK